jgi:hypothetical protein
MDKVKLQQINASKIEVGEIKWQGPFSWIGYENQKTLTRFPT